MNRRSFRRNTLDVCSIADGNIDIDITQQQNQKGHKDNNKPNSSLQHPAALFDETNINSLCSCQQLSPETTADTTSLNTTTEISHIVPNNIQTPITANNLNKTSNFTQDSTLKIEAQLSVLKTRLKL